MTRCKYVVALALVAAGLVQMGFAQFIEKENLLARHFPTKERYLANIVALRFGSNLIYHNGPVIQTVRCSYFLGSNLERQRPWRRDLVDELYRRQRLEQIWAMAKPTSST